MTDIHSIHTILYVSDQRASTHFYTQLLDKSPDLDVPGMTEFRLSPHFTLGLMPEVGIAKILSDKTLHPSQGNGIPRCELYFYVTDIGLSSDRAIHCGAKPISPIQDRDWGDKVCYFADPDGHIIAFATPLTI